MKLSELLEEKQGRGITFVDIDETLFFTQAMIYVVDKDTKKVLKKLTNQEFNVYKLGDNEEFDFIEFSDSHIFSTTSKPIDNMIRKVNSIFARIKSSGSKSELHLLTARANFTDPGKLISYLKSFGLKIGHMKNGDIHIIRAGERGKRSAIAKKEIIGEFLAKDSSIKRVRLYDDAESNLKSFLELKSDFPDVEFTAFMVDHGKVSTYKRLK